MQEVAIQGLVRRLLTQEDAQSQDQQSIIGAAERVVDRLRVHLSLRIGQEGFRMLLARALAVATTRFPYLSAVRVGADGSLAGLRVAAGAHSQAASEGAVAIMANLLGLLITFIGEDLTLRLLSTAWPGLDSDGGFDSDGGTDRENEKP